MRPYQQIINSSLDIATQISDATESWATSGQGQQGLFDDRDYHDASNAWLSPGLGDDVMSDDEAWALVGHAMDRSDAVASWNVQVDNNGGWS